ncbi:MAG: metal-dependent hydrolase [Gammaproteobacteria bacterium]|nr:MAG: metal-dependent hydrolase [Gammaproteobacteria bacterium]|tara:strand:+ start:971 stop:1975 length:1005 start_codon:yes stop_codon:yes gene_type:complete
MDPLSQGTVGAAFAQSTASKNNILKIGIIGFLAGLAPDLDVLIQSSTDPILFLEYHRQFSHSLFFIPFGSMIVALIIFPLVKKSMSFKTIYIASFLGYATHGLLDACTSYGTLLFWPFSNERITWNNISIVDPLFTIPVLILVGVAIKTKKRIYSFFSIGWVIFYLSLGFVQYERALSAANDLAESRGHNPERLTLKPSFGNLILWKSIYQNEKTFYVDAIRTVQSSIVCSGESIEIFNYQQHLPGLDKKSQQAKDVERFRWFSQDYLGFDKGKKLVTDVRYSMLPNQIEPMWGLIINDQLNNKDHAIWWTGRDLDQRKWNLFIGMLRGKECQK